jgi:hypothetical protein
MYAAAIAGLLAGCGDNGVDDYTVSEVDSVAAYTVFNPDSGDIPYPNDILFAPNGSGNSDPGDGTLNIPFEDGDADAAIKSALNTLDGFSTLSPVSVSISGSLDAATLPGHVRLYRVMTGASAETNFVPAVGAVSAELTYGVDFVAVLDGGRLAVIPLRPLESHASYMVVLTEGIADAEGKVLAPDVITRMLNGTHPLADAEGNPTLYFDPDPVANAVTAATLEGLRQLTQAMFAQLIGRDGMECTATAEGVTCGNIIMAWSFTTQTIGTVQNALAQGDMQAQLALAPTGATTRTFVPTLNGTADVYVGSLSSLPQYMPQATSANPMPALTGTFSYDGGLPVIEANVTIPVLATVPNDPLCVRPETGWPVVIYQHGVTRARSDLLAYAETFAAPPLCTAAVAIDLPLHGITDPENPFYMAGLERTFDIDVATETLNDGYGYAIESYLPDGTVDSTGVHYFNLASPLTSRDNIRQSTSDLLQLEHAIGSAAGVAFDADSTHFVAHSLGTIASTGYIAHTDGLKTAILAMPGQGALQVLNHSPVFGPIIKGGLASAGIIEGTPEFDAFMVAAQTLVDDVDPANYTATIAANDALPMLFFEAVGDGTPGSGDQHIPNSIPSAPLSGTDPFLRLVGAVDINTTVPLYLAGPKTVTRLVAGEHRSPLDPQYSAEATAEIHTEMASFIGSGGASILVTYPETVKD